MPEDFPSVKAIQSQPDADTETPEQAAYEHARKMEEFFFVGPESNARLGGLVGLEADEYLALNENRRENIRSFVRAAAEKVSAGALESRIFHEHVAEGKFSRPLRELAPLENIPHDFQHVIFAAGESGGRSLVPAYMQVSTLQDQWSDPASIQEEMSVDLYTGANFIKKVYEGEMGDPDTDRFSPARFMRGLSSEELALQTTDPFMFGLILYEKWFANKEEMGESVQHIPDGPARYDAAMAQIAAHRGPAYLRVARAVYEDTITNTPDPQWRLKLFEEFYPPKSQEI